MVSPRARLLGSFSPSAPVGSHNYGIIEGGNVERSGTGEGTVETSVKGEKDHRISSIKLYLNKRVWEHPR